MQQKCGARLNLHFHPHLSLLSNYLTYHVQNFHVLLFRCTPLIIPSFFFYSQRRYCVLIQDHLEFPVVLAKKQAACRLHMTGEGRRCPFFRLRPLRYQTENESQKREALGPICKKFHYSRAAKTGPSKITEQTQCKLKLNMNTHRLRTTVFHGQAQDGGFKGQEECLSIVLYCMNHPDIFYNMRPLDERQPEKSQVRAGAISLTCHFPKYRSRYADTIDSLY